jgi:hypothetical protein
LENDVANGWMDLIEKVPVVVVWVWSHENKRLKDVV